MDACEVDGQLPCIGILNVTIATATRAELSNVSKMLHFRIQCFAPKSHNAVGQVCVCMKNDPRKATPTFPCDEWRYIHYIWRYAASSRCSLGVFRAFGAETNRGTNGGMTTLLMNALIICVGGWGGWRGGGVYGFMTGFWCCSQTDAPAPFQLQRVQLKRHIF